VPFGHDCGRDVRAPRVASSVQEKRPISRNPAKERHPGGLYPGRESPLNGAHGRELSYLQLVNLRAGWLLWLRLPLIEQKLGDFVTLQGLIQVSR